MDSRKGLEREFSKMCTSLAWPKGCEMKGYVRKETISQSLEILMCLFQV